MTDALAITESLDPLPGFTPARSYDFYRCVRCTRVVTQPQMQRGLSATKALRICPCGGLKFQPTNPRWHEYFLPRVLAFAWTRARDLGLRQVLANLKADVRRVWHPEAEA